MERLSPVRKDLIAHAEKAATLLETAQKAFDAQRRKIVSPEETRELCVGLMSDVSRELIQAVRLIAKAVPPDAR